MEGFQAYAAMNENGIVGLSTPYGAARLNLGMDQAAFRGDTLTWTIVLTDSIDHLDVTSFEMNFTIDSALTFDSLLIGGSVLPSGGVDILDTFKAPTIPTRGCTRVRGF